MVGPGSKSQKRMRAKALATWRVGESELGDLLLLRSMLPSSTRDDKKDGNSQIRRASLKLRRAIANPRSVRVSRREFLLILATFLVVTFLLRSRSREPSTETEAPVKKGAKGPAVLPHQKVPWGKEAQNWGPILRFFRTNARKADSDTHR